MMLVSLHLPKTAGSSFAKSLEDHFGSYLMRDFDDYPLNSPPYKRKLSAILKSAKCAALRTGVVCVHGHFLPAKYRLLAARTTVRFVTWMRDPVERLASHYQFWFRTYDRRTAQALHRRVVEESWSFERFYQSRELRNVYEQFLWRFPLSKFDFIGITEHYESEFSFFCETYLGVPGAAYRLNRNDSRESPSYVTDPQVRAEIERLHQRDVLIYRHALELRRGRCR